MKSTQSLSNKVAAVTSSNLKSGPEEKLVGREALADQSESENILGSASPGWPETFAFKRSRHSYTYYQSDFG